MHFKCKLKYVKDICHIPDIYKLTQKKKKKKSRSLYIIFLSYAIFLFDSLSTHSKLEKQLVHSRSPYHMNFA